MSSSNPNCAAFSTVVRERRSLRAFLPEPVAAPVLAEVFELAQRTPSNCNTQPWVVHVASGTTLARLREVLPERFARGELSLDYPYEGKYAGVYRERQFAAAHALYAAAGIAREDRAGRDAQFMRNFRFFDAPHVAFLFMPEGFGLREAADVGMYAQTLLLALAAHGLGACPQTSLGFLADAVRERLDIEADLKLLFGISFGYPDPDAPVNACVTARDEVVSFHD